MLEVSEKLPQGCVHSVRFVILLNCCFATASQATGPVLTYFCCASVTANPDVARPDKITGADINATCQEVRITKNRRILSILLMLFTFQGWHASSEGKSLHHSS